MTRKRVFISSVQSEFADERQLLFEYLNTDALLGIYFEPFIFENVPALNASPAAVFLDEVRNCDIYLGVFGESYGFEDAEGISPTEREYDEASKHGKVRLIYVKQATQRNHKEELLITKAENSIVRKGFTAPEQLRTAVYASFVNYLIENEFIRTTPFDATICPEATISDLNEEKLREFVDVAHRKRGLPFDRHADITKILTHLDLVKGGRVTNAALLLFSDRPQRYFIASEVRCAHFHGLRATKPIPSYQVYKGNVFEMIDSAVDFVLSKINLYTGDRSNGPHVEVQYEFPVQAVTEAIVNAVAHRDYTSNGSVQVMLFPDRLEVLNPGRLPAGLTIEELFTAHKSIPANPLLAESLYLYGTIERMGTGTGDIVSLCADMGLGQPEFRQGSGFEVVLFRKSFVEYATPQVTPQATPQVTPHVTKLLEVFEGEMNRAEIQEKLALKDREHVRRKYIQPALDLGLIEPLYPDSPRHPGQMYRLTALAKELRSNNGIVQKNEA